MTDDIFKLKVDVDGDDVIIEWDETHPSAIALGCNEWTSEEWIERLKEGLAADEEQEEA